MLNVQSRSFPLLVLLLTVACGGPPASEQPRALVSVCGLSTPAGSEMPRALIAVDGPALPTWRAESLVPDATCDDGVWEWTSSKPLTNFKANLFLFTADKGEGVVLGSIDLQVLSGQACDTHGGVTRAFFAVREESVCESPGPSSSPFDEGPCYQTRIKARVRYWFVRCDDGFQSDHAL